jgi:ketosteroid isomerase-like protein
MAKENVESLRQCLDAFNRRDRAAWLALCDPELENVPPRDWPESDPIRGSEAVWDFYVEGNEPWEESPFEYVEIIDAGNDKVVADLRRKVRGKASGASVAWSYWQVGTTRNGKMLRFEWFTDRAEALEAAGLSEQDAHPDS